MRFSRFVQAFAILMVWTLMILACDVDTAGSRLSAGDQETITADGVSFSLVYVPGGLTFPIGTNDDEGTATVDNAYWIGETEVTYELWQKVYLWATDAARGTNQYYFANAGRQGGDNGSGPVGTSQHPVTTVNWRDCIVWCNALTEWHNAQTGAVYDCVYTHSGAIIRDSRDSNATACDGAIAGTTATGFRLSTCDEYELASRWRNDAVNTVGGYSDPYFTKGNSASGDTQAYNAASPTVGEYSVFYDNSDSTAAVKSKTGNALGLFDMSGNVWDWCFDLTGPYRIFRGGSWINTASGMQIGYSNNFDSPEIEDDCVGFRIVRTHAH